LVPVLSNVANRQRERFSSLSRTVLLPPATRHGEAATPAGTVILACLSIVSASLLNVHIGRSHAIASCRPSAERETFLLPCPRICFGVTLTRKVVAFLPRLRLGLRSRSSVRIVIFDWCGALYVANRNGERSSLFEPYPSAPATVTVSPHADWNCNVGPCLSIVRDHH